MPVATATTELSVRDRKLRSGLRRGVASIKRFGRSVATAMKVATTAILAVGVAAVGAARLFIKAFATQERAEAKLVAVIKATGMAAGFTAEEMKKMARELQKITTIGDEVIISGQAILATFKNIKGDEFKRATLAMLDMAEVLETDLKSAAILVGKALNDPVLGATALSRSGIQFTEVQKKMIKTMVEANNIIGAQNIVLRELEGQMGGAAVAAGETLSGRLIKLKNQLGDVSEAIGEVLIKRLDKWIGTLEHLTTALGNNTSAVDDSITKIADWALIVAVAGNRLLALERITTGIVRKGFKGMGEDLAKLREDLFLLQEAFFPKVKKTLLSREAIEANKLDKELKAALGKYEGILAAQEKIDKIAPEKAVAAPGAPVPTGPLEALQRRILVQTFFPEGEMDNFAVALRPRFEGLTESWDRITSAASEKEQKPAEKTADATEKTADATRKTATSNEKIEGWMGDAVALLGDIDGKIGLTSARFGE